MEKPGTQAPTGTHSILSVPTCLPRDSSDLTPSLFFFFFFFWGLETFRCAMGSWPWPQMFLHKCGGAAVEEEEAVVGAQCNGKVGD